MAHLHDRPASGSVSLSTLHPSLHTSNMIIGTLHQSASLSLGRAPLLQLHTVLQLVSPWCCAISMSPGSFVNGLVVPASCCCVWHSRERPRTMPSSLLYCQACQRFPQASQVSTLQKITEEPQMVFTPHNLCPF